jgi:hypothetical protein
MTADEKIISRLRELARRTPVVRSLLGRRTSRAALAAQLAALQSDLDHVRKRHGEQIERLEDLVGELVHSAESLRRALARQNDGE